MAESEHDDEDIIVLKAMIDVNLPQFVGDDISLFKGIVSDVFPNIPPPELNRPVLKEALQQACKKHNLQATSWFVTKMIELYEMIKVQHGIMIIGRPMSCKSQLYSILSEALTKLAEENKFDKFTTYHKAMFKVINPKSMTLHQLYGFVSSTPFLLYFQVFHISIL